MANGRRVNPVYRSISRPLTILGAERKLFFFAMCIGAGTFNLLGSLLGGVLMFLLLFLTIAILLTFGFWLLGELKFFIPYKAVLFHEYGTLILVYLATLFLNLFAAAFALNRKFFLKDTGRKLSHLDKQLHVGQTEVRAPSLEEEVD